jgi:hypothetical protein
LNNIQLLKIGVLLDVSVDNKYVKNKFSETRSTWDYFHDVPGFGGYFNAPNEVTRLRQWQENCSDLMITTRMDKLAMSDQLTSTEC